MTGFYTKYKIGLNWVKFWLALHTTDPLSLDQKKKKEQKNQTSHLPIKLNMSIETYL